MLEELRDQNDNLNDDIVYYSPLAEMLSIALVYTCTQDDEHAFCKQYLTHLHMYITYHIFLHSHHTAAGHRHSLEVHIKSPLPQVNSSESQEY